MNQKTDNIYLRRHLKLLGSFIIVLGVMVAILLGIVFFAIEVMNSWDRNWLVQEAWSQQITEKLTGEDDHTLIYISPNWNSRIQANYFNITNENRIPDFFTVLDNSFENEELYVGINFRRVFKTIEEESEEIHHLITKMQESGLKGPYTFYFGYHPTMIASFNHNFHFSVNDLDQISSVEQVADFIRNSGKYVFFGGGSHRRRSLQEYVSHLFENKDSLTSSGFERFYLHISIEEAENWSSYFRVLTLEELEAFSTVEEVMKAITKT